MNYVSEDKLFAWYRRTAREPWLSNAELLETVHQHFVDTKDETYTLPAEKTVSGQPETYAFRCDKIGACGADTGFMYF